MRAIKINKNTAASELINDIDNYQLPTNDSAYIWFDILSGDKKAEEEFLNNNLKISPLAISDAQRDRHPPKFEQFSKFNFLLIKAFDANTSSIDFNILHISFFVSNQFLVTVHNDTSPSIDSAWEICQNSERGDVKDPYSLLYIILRNIIDRYTSVILMLESRLEEIESEMIEKPSDSLLSELIRYRTKTQYLFRIFNNQDIVINEMLTLDVNLQANNIKHKFQDIEEHVGRLAGLTNLQNEVIKNLIDGYISISGHRLNNIMKTLTIVALIFMPITFIAGIYGMNFEYIPELKFKYGYFVALGAMALLAGGLIAFFKKIRWI